MKLNFEKRVFGKKAFSLSEALGNLFLIFAIYLVVLIYSFSFIYTGAKIDGSSMENTYYNDDIIYYKSTTDIDYGDVIIIEASKNHEIVKRVIGLSGDRINFNVTYNNGSLIYTLTLNGKVVIEPYIKDQKGNHNTFLNMYGNSINSLINTNAENFDASTGDFIVPENHVFALGDNRGVSNDSSTYGAFSNEQIVGRADFLVKAEASPIIELMKQFFWPF